MRSELIYLLVSLDKQYTAEAPGEPWKTYYAREMRVISSHQAADAASCTHLRLRAGEHPVMPLRARAA